MQTETDEFIREKLQELETSVQARNEKAKQSLEDSLEKAQTIKKDHLREMCIQSAEDMYRSALQFNLGILDTFSTTIFSTNYGRHISFYR